MHRSVQFALLALLVWLPLCKATAQQAQLAEWGYQYLTTTFRQDPVDIIVLTKQGDEKKRKPLLLFVQGSLPRPLVLIDKEGKPYRVFPFDAEPLLEAYHLAIIGKPYIPLMSEISALQPNMTYLDTATNNYPRKYIERSNLDYYSARNKAVVMFLQKQPWISTQGLVLAGHSEGASIATRMAIQSENVSRLIYSSSNPMGILSTVISQMRETDDASQQAVEEQFKLWEAVVQDPENNTPNGQITNKALYGFYSPPFETLMKLKIPVLIAWGTKDTAAPFFDYARIEAIRHKKKNLTFIPYVGRQHNFFAVDENGRTNWEDFGWDQVAIDWSLWLQQKPAAGTYNK
jgi:dienelactone hydrolase